MTEQIRFARKGHPGTADAMAALALVRAMAHVLTERKILTPDDIQEIRGEALRDIPDRAIDEIRAARGLIEHEFP